MVSGRSALSLLVAVLDVVVVPYGRAVAAPPPLVVFHAPPRAPAEVSAARDAVARAAGETDTAFVDLSAPPTPAPAAARLVTRAIELYDGLRIDEAITALDAAFDEVRASGAAGLRPSELSDLFLYRGLAFQQKGDAGHAWDDLVRAVSVDPTRVLDPARFPPRVVQAVQRAASQVRGQAMGRLVVVTPAGCTLFVDDREIAAPPELPYGEHFLRVECPGERTAASVVVLARERQEVEAPRARTPSVDDEALVRLGRERGARTILIVGVVVSGAGPPTARLRLREVPSGTLVAEASVALPAGGNGAATARAAAERLIARAQGPTGGLPTSAPRPTSWYERPWVWGAVGVAITAAVLLPFALDRSSSPTTLTVHPVGTVWPRP